MIQEIILMPRADSGYPHNFMVNSCVFKDDESESEVKTNSGPRVCPLLVKNPHFTCVEHAQCPLLAHCVSTHTVVYFKSHHYKSPYRFSRRITSQLQNWAFLTYLHGKPGNTCIYPMQERQNVSNTSRHQDVVVLLLNLPCYSYFSHSEKLWFLQLWHYSSGEATWCSWEMRQCIIYMLSYWYGTF